MTVQDRVETVRWILHDAAEILLTESGTDLSHTEMLQHAEGALWAERKMGRDEILQRLFYSASIKSAMSASRMPMAHECDFVGYSLPEKSVMLNPPGFGGRALTLTRWILWIACQHILASGREDALIHWRDALRSGNSAAAELSTYAYIAGVNLTFGDWSPQDVQRRDFPKELKS